MRIDHDMLGELEIEQDALWGVHTQRSIINFPLTGRSVHRAWFRAMGETKLACVLQMKASGECSDDEKWAAVENACREMAEGKLDFANKSEALQGGAGTSLNMNVNEVIANRALQILGDKEGNYKRVSPLDDINRHQSTNDACPTALHVALLRSFEDVCKSAEQLSLSFEKLGKKFEKILKVGRTQYQDAVLTSLGREMHAYAAVVKRCAVALRKASESLLSVNLGGTAIGTSVGAPKAFVDGVVAKLAAISGLPLVQCEDLVDGTQNQDALALCSGALKTLCASLLKITVDLRFMSSGPQSGIGEITLPERQAGSSIMPGKVNPVICECVAQVCIKVIGDDVAVGMACASGCLELNPYLPLVGDLLLHDCDSLAAACRVMRELCVDGIKACEEKCAGAVSTSTALITAMVPVIGYDRACEIGVYARENGKSIRDAIMEKTSMTAQDVDSLLDDRCLSAH